MKACENNNKEIIKELILNGCNIFQKSKVFLIRIISKDNKLAINFVTDEQIKAELRNITERLEKKLLMIYLSKKSLCPFSKIPDIRLHQTVSYI